MDEGSQKIARRSVSPQGVRFIAGWEGFRSHLYNDALGHCTIGYGHLVHRGRCNGSEPPQFKRGITRVQGLALLQNDVRSHSAVVDARVRVALRQHQFDALASFAFNVGTGAFAGSTLLRRLNSSDYAAVPSELMRWTNGGLPGLVRRRRAEGQLFRDGSYPLMDDEMRNDADAGGDGENAVAPPSFAEGGPADEGQHDSYGENPADVGEQTDEPDTPVPDDDSEALAAADRLHIAMTAAVNMGLRITSTTNDDHGPNSYHYSKPYRYVVIRGRRYQVGRAADVGKTGNPDALYRQFFRRMEALRPTELFYDPMGYSWKNGQRVPWTVGGHRNHVHVAF